MTTPENPNQPMSDAAAEIEAAKILDESTVGSKMLVDIEQAEASSTLDHVESAQIPSEELMKLARGALDPLEAMYAIPSYDASKDTHQP